MRDKQTLEIVPEQPTDEAPLKLGFDIPTVLVRIRAYRYLMVVIAIFSILMGISAGFLFGHKTFEATTVLLYKPPAGAGPESDGNEAPSLLTQLDMLKIPANLEETRRRLKLNTSVEKLGSAVSAEVPINSSLMVIRVKWNSSEKAALIANTLRDVFLERQLAIQHQEAAAKIHDLEARLDRVRVSLLTAESNLKQFTIANHVVDLDKEAGWYLQQLINAELFYEQATGDKRADQLQEAKINSIMSELKTKARDEEDQMLGDPGKAGLDPATRAKDELIRGRMANLKMKEAELQRDKILFDDGILSQADYEKAKAAYESEKFALYNNSPSAGLLKEMTLKELNIRLNGISDQQKVAQLKAAVERVRAKLDALPLVQREYLALQREVTIRAAESERIDQFLGLARRQYESEAFGFSVVSPAKQPVLPLQSNRRIIFLAISVLGSLLGLVTIVLMEIANKKVFSFADGISKLKTEVLAGLEDGKSHFNISMDDYLKLASRLRMKGIRPGSRLIVVSPTSGEGAPQVALSLAYTLAGAGEPCFLIDGNFRDLSSDRLEPGTQCEPERRSLARLLGNTLGHGIAAQPAVQKETSLTLLGLAENGKGFSDLLAENEYSDYSVKLDQRVRLLSRGTCPRPDLLLSPRLTDVLKHSCSDKEITLVHSSPALPYPDATFLAHGVSSALVVVATGKCSAAQIENCITSLKAHGVAVLGIVITGIGQAHIGRSKT